MKMNQTNPRCRILARQPFNGRRMPAVVLAALLLMAVLVSCGKKPELRSDINDETGGFDVTAANISGAACSGTVTIREGECLVASPQLEKGHFVLSVCPAEEVDRVMEQTAGAVSAPADGALNYEDIAILTLTLDSSEMCAYTVEPGEYYVFAAVEEEKTTGTLSVMPYSIEEINAQNAALLDELEAGGVTPVEVQDLPTMEGIEK